jgi:peptidoglycan/xylan/chitin deacetylase (PgdA/CDA1 family)
MPGLRAVCPDFEREATLPHRFGQVGARYIVPSRACACFTPALRATIPLAYDGVLPMKTIAPCVLLFASLSAVASAQNSSPVVMVARWPQDRLAAISLTFDDGINSDLDFVGPILKKHHLPATFFVATAMGPWEKRQPEWKQLALDGNELANHTVHHPCLLEQITPHSQDYTPALFEAEIRDAAFDLVKTLNSSRGLTFAYPCGNMSFGKPQDEVANAALYLRYVSEHSFAARGAGAASPVNPDDLNVLAVADLGPTAGKGFPALLAQAEPAFASHNWGVFCFHGVGGDWLAITPEALEELAVYLERHPEIWTAPFGDVIRYIQERKSLSIQITRNSPASLDLSLQWPMDKQIYDVPLTLKVQLPTVWNSVTATGDGKPIPARITARTNATTILLDVPAQTKSVRLFNPAP